MIIGRSWVNLKAVLWCYCIAKKLEMRLGIIRKRNEAQYISCALQSVKSSMKMAEKCTSRNVPFHPTPSLPSIILYDRINPQVREICKQPSLLGLIAIAFRIAEIYNSNGEEESARRPVSPRRLHRGYSLISVFRKLSKIRTLKIRALVLPTPPKFGIFGISHRIPPKYRICELKPCIPLW